MRTAVVVTFLSLYAVAQVAQIARIGKKRDPITPTEVAVGLPVNMAVAAGIVYLYAS